jgi:predicted MPP superfamily phosphohydrolase
MLRVEEDRMLDLMSFHLAWAADLHLEFLSPEKFDLFLQSLRDVQADGLLVCGDISTSPRLRQKLIALSTIGKPVYFVCGNHDYYRGSFEKTTTLVEATCREHRALRWLSLGEIIPLTSTTALMGHEGWGDGRSGLGVRSSIGMNDHVLIEDLRILDREQLFTKLDALGRASARYAEDIIARAARRFDHLIFATHVPPFVEAARHQGAPTSPEFLPFYVNVSLGEVLLRLARALPTKRFEVLCGHTHGAFEYEVAPNLKIRVAGASYGDPKVEGILRF